MALGVGDDRIARRGVGRHGGQEGGEGELKNGAGRADMKRHGGRGNFEDGEMYDAIILN